MNKTTVFSVVVLIIILGILGFLYETRPAAAPSQDIASVADSIAASSTVGGTIYRIDPSSSLVSFGIDEVLRGSPNHVVGTSTEVAGDIVLSANAITFGTIKINARTFITDSNQRNGAIARLILKSDSDANEFITFVPNAPFSISSPLMASTSVSLQIAGNLTISGVTKPETFAITGQVNDGSIEGTATATLKRSDFGLTIPNIPFIANVPDTFTITATIVANEVTR